MSDLKAEVATKVKTEKEIMNEQTSPMKLPIRVENYFVLRDADGELVARVGGLDTPLLEDEEKARLIVRAITIIRSW